MIDITGRFAHSTEGLLVYSPLDGSRGRLATVTEESLWQSLQKAKLERDEATAKLAGAEAVVEAARNVAVDIYDCVQGGSDFATVLEYTEKLTDALARLGGEEE